MEEYIGAFLAESSYADSTKESYRYALTRLAIWLSEHSLTLDDLTLERYQVFLNGHGWSSNMRRLYASAIRVFLRWMGYKTHPVLKTKLPRDTARPGRSLTLDEVGQLLGSFNTMSLVGWRNVAMLALMIETGLRATEICRLKLADVDIIRRRLTVIAKGQKWREGVFSEETARYLAKWLEARPEVARPDCYYFFVSYSGNRPGTQMTKDGLRANFRRYGIKADIGRLSPHDMRRTMAMLLTEAGAPSRLVQELGGWDDIRMVERYTRNLQPGQIEKFSPITALSKKIPPVD